MRLSSERPDGIIAAADGRDAISPFTNVYGLARTLLAINTLLVLVVHSTDSLFRPLGEEIGSAYGSHFPLNLSLFSVLSGDLLPWARALAIVVLLLVISGWRPRFTGILQWWVSWSFSVSSFVIEGGDQITAILTLLLIPITLLDPRRSHWAVTSAIDPEGLRSWSATSAWWVIRLQVAFLYLHASVGKLPSPEWSNGTAVYYWFVHEQFGATAWIQSMLLPVLSQPLGVLLATWGVLALELLLFVAVAMPRSRWSGMLLLGLLFHSSIILVHGLVSFFFAMAGALVLYLRPLDKPFDLSRNWLAGRRRSHALEIRVAPAIPNIVTAVTRREENGHTIFP
jgi:antimicrobial peptide system SdpB family protein